MAPYMKALYSFPHRLGADRSCVRMIGPRELTPLLTRAGFATDAVRRFDTCPRNRVESMFGPWGAPQWALRGRKR
jgi:hypothetical protein